VAVDSKEVHTIQQHQALTHMFWLGVIQEHPDHECELVSQHQFRGEAVERRKQVSVIAKAAQKTDQPADVDVCIIFVHVTGFTIAQQALY
jgi:hypothetical protein